MTPLEDGHSETTPAGDTVMRSFDLAFVDMLAAMAQSVGGAFVRNAAFGACDFGRPSGLFNSAVLLRPVLEADGVSDVESAFGDGTGSVFLWSQWPLPDLSSRGWTKEGHPPLMLRSARLATVEVPKGMRIEAVEDTDRLAECERLWVEAFPFDDCKPFVPGHLLGRSLLGNAALRSYLLFDADTPVATASVTLADAITVVDMVVTAPEHRGRGAGRFLTDFVASVDPTKPALLLASDDGRPVYEGLGFAALSRYSLWRKDRP